MVVFWQSDCIPANLLFSVKVFSFKVVVFGQSGFIQAKWLFLGESGCLRANVIVFGQGGCIRAKWLYSGKCGC